MMVIIQPWADRMGEGMHRNETKTAKAMIPMVEVAESDIGCPMVKRLQIEIYGNGKPEDAMRTRLLVVEQTVKQIKHLCWLMVLGIGGLAAKAIGGWIDGVMK